MNEFFNIFEYLTIGADVTQFINLSKNIQDEKLFKQLLQNQATIIQMLKELKGENKMKMLTHLIDRAEATLDEVEWYTEKAHHLKMENKPLADAYIKIAEMHVTIYGILHEQMVNIIEKYRKEGNEPPKEMLAIWNYEHEKLMKEFEHEKFMIDDYKKSY